VLRWRGATASLHTWRTEIAGALALVALGALAGAIRRIPLDRCARSVDRALDGSGRLPPIPSAPSAGERGWVMGSGERRSSSDRVLSALAFTRLGDTAATPFMRAAIADAIAHAQHVAPRAAAPLRRPRATPAFA